MIMRNSSERKFIESLSACMEKVSPWRNMDSLAAFKVVLPINPVSVQQGSRAAFSGGKPRFYSDPKKKLYYGQVKEEVAHQLPDKPLEGPLFVVYGFYLERPGYLKKDGSPRGAVPHVQKPDFENLIKGTGDALEAAGLFADDKQIWGSVITKLYCELDLFPRIEVTVYHEKQKQ